MPSDKYRSYDFSVDRPVEAVAEELIKDVREYGLSFIAGHVDMTALVEGMQHRRFAVRFMVAYRIPVGLFLLGRKNEAKDFMEAELAAAGDRQDPASLRFKAFAERLAERIARDIAC